MTLKNASVAKMEDNEMKRFAVSCKKGVEKMKKGKTRRSSKKKRVLRTSDGRTVTVCNSLWLKKKAKRFEKNFIRKEASAIRTNIQIEPMYAPLSQARDYWLEHILKSDGYTFQNMFLVKNPFGEAPLTALALFVTEVPCQVRVTVKGKIPETDFTSVLPETKYHRVPVLGLYPGRMNHIHFELLDQDSQVIDERTVSIKTRPLPQDLKKIVKVRKVSDDPAFENILVAGGIDVKTCVFDREGRIRYYLKRKPKGYGIFPLSGGRFIFMEREISAPSYTNPQSVQSYDMDYLGRVRKTYLVKNGAHHTVEEKTPGGNIMTASSSMEGHSEDLILEIDRQSGQIVKKVMLGDIFDETYQDMMDWAHINSASHYEKDNSVLVSMRNIHSISSVDWETGEMRWLLCDPRFWEGTEMEEKLLKPVGDVPWFYQQHAVFELDVDFDGNPDTKHIIVFDNHWHKRRKVKFFDKDKNTYISFYTINEKERTVSFHKRFPCPKSKIRSNAILCPEKDRLYAMAGSLVTPIDEGIGVIREYDFTSGEVLSEFVVKPGFFRAHEFTPDVAALAEPLLASRDYVCGDLKRPEPLSEEAYQALEVQEKCRVKDEKIDYVMQEDLLYIHEVDHSVRKVYFFGKKGNYYVEFADTYQTMQLFEEAEYYITMWLDTLPSDYYRLYLDVRGEVQNTGKYISK